MRVRPGAGGGSTYAFGTPSPPPDPPERTFPHVSTRLEGVFGSCAFGAAPAERKPHRTVSVRTLVERRPSCFNRGNGS